MGENKIRNRIVSEMGPGLNEDISIVWGNLRLHICAAGSRL